MIDKQDLEKIERILDESFENLIKKDHDLIRGHNRHGGHVHEVCIRHRLAVYIENCIQRDEMLRQYNVDIEYNKNYYDSKTLSFDNEEVSVRPDILVHRRMKKDESIPQHYLVVEAKKNRGIDYYDKKKVVAFLKDQKYEYQFGLTVQFGCFNPITAQLFYLQGDELVCKNLYYPKE